MTYKDLEATLLNWQAIEDLCRNGGTEDACLDFKWDAYGGADSHKLELRRDATSLANFRGGVILIGVDEDANGAARAVSPLLDASLEADRIRDVLSANIHPRLADLRVVPLCEKQPKGCVAVFLPPAKGLKHLILAGEGRYEGWVRQDKSKRGMTHRELAESLRSDSSEWRNLIRIEELVSEGKLFYVQPNMNVSREENEWIHVACHNLRDLELKKMSSGQHLHVPLADVGMSAPHSMHRSVLVLERGALDWEPSKEQWVYIPRLTEETRSRLELAREIKKAMAAGATALITPIDRLWPRAELPFTIKQVERDVIRVQGKGCAYDFAVPLAAIRTVIASSGSNVKILLKGGLRFERKSHTGSWVPS